MIIKKSCSKAEEEEENKKDNPNIIFYKFLQLFRSTKVFLFSSAQLFIFAKMILVISRQIK